MQIVKWLFQQIRTYWRGETSHPVERSFLSGAVLKSGISPHINWWFVARSGFWRKIFLWVTIKFISILILIQNNYSIHFYGIFKYCQVNTCSCQYQYLQSNRLKEVRSGMLALWVIGSEGKLKVNLVKLFNLGVTWYFISHSDWEIIVINTEAF